MIGIPLALVASNAAEWAFHKYLLHPARKDRRSFFHFHMADHHRNCLCHQFYDPDYETPWWKMGPHGKEVVSLAAVSALLLPLLPVAPFFTLTSWWCAARYYRVHKRAHMDVEWAREHLPWHYDHHMGPNQEANWCVTHPWFDTVKGTRVVYKDTPREVKDWARRSAVRMQRLNAGSAPAA